MQAHNQDIEPDGGISEAFNHLEQSMESEFRHTRKSIDKLRYEQHQTAIRERF
jgi:phage terminase small subunit